MNKGHKFTYIVLVLIALLVSYLWYFFHSELYISYELDYQVNAMIKNHDMKKENNIYWKVDKLYFTKR